MRLVVGLGNPGLQYAQTRHNVGWLVIDEVARRAGATWRKDRDAEVAEARFGSQKALLVKPQTFMNDSGRAVAPLFNFYKLNPNATLVIQDDLDSPFGLLRLRSGGRHGGQNGVRDIIAKLGREDFPRLKIGISRPPAGWTVVNWVMSKWAEEERRTLDALVGLGADAVELWVSSGLLDAQARFNNTDLRPSPEPASPEPEAAPSPRSDPAQP